MPTLGKNHTTIVYYDHEIYVFPAFLLILTTYEAFYFKFSGNILVAISGRERPTCPTSHLSDIPDVRQNNCKHASNPDNNSSFVGLLECRRTGCRTTAQPRIRPAAAGF